MPQSRTGKVFLRVVLSLAVLALALTVDGAGARVGWCRSDPVIAVDGKTADLLIAVPLEDLAKVKGPTKIVVTTPEGMRARLVAYGVGFGHSEEFKFATSESLKVTDKGIELRIEVSVPATDDGMPVRVEFVPHPGGLLDPTTATGTANSWVAIEALL